jgi:hypothetical protein
MRNVQFLAINGQRRHQRAVAALNAGAFAAWKYVIMGKMALFFAKPGVIDECDDRGHSTPFARDY